MNSSICSPPGRPLPDRKRHRAGKTGRSKLGLRASKRKRRRIQYNQFLDSSNATSSDSDGNSDRRSPRTHRSESLYLQKTPNGEKTLNRTIQDEIQPIPIDKSLAFSSIGGLQSHIDKLKEMVIFPLLYKEFFISRNVSPPRGVLFHGPPGTGKTLLARTLASEATAIAGKEVSVFIRKGADVLSKWIGESERVLKILFEEATSKQPSIIFFDEIDGLAPIRSSKTEQIHNSVVSTLLAEMDGLKDRGDVIVIGATNRIDALDPALRRPGRFDLELQFSLPSFQERREIFTISLSNWNPTISQSMIAELALMTAGYSGADIKFLCAEASLCALRRSYPQIYETNKKIDLDYDTVQVCRLDWEDAMKIVGRSSERSVFSSNFTAAPLPHALEPLLSCAVKEVSDIMKRLFPYKSKTIFQPSTKALLIDMGVNHDVVEHVISAALCSVVESVPVSILTIHTLMAKNSSDDTIGLAIFFTEIKNRDTANVIYIPYLDHLYESLSSAAQLVFDQEMSRISYNPTLLVTFCKTASKLDGFKNHFKNVRPLPINTKARCEFFRRTFQPILDYNFAILERDFIKRYRDQVKKVYMSLVRLTCKLCFTISQLLELRFELLNLAEEHGKSDDKAQLLAELEAVVRNLQESLPD